MAPLQWAIVCPRPRSTRRLTRPLRKAASLGAVVLAACGGSSGRTPFPSGKAKDPRAPAEQAALAWLDACDQGDYEKLVSLSDPKLRLRLRQSDIAKKPDHHPYQVQLVKGDPPRLTIVLGHRSSTTDWPISVQVENVNGQWLVTDAACP